MSRFSGSLCIFFQLLFNGPSVLKLIAFRLDPRSNKTEEIVTATGSSLATSSKKMPLSRLCVLPGSAEALVS